MLKQLMLSKKIEQRKAILNELIEQEKGFATRTAELEAALDEAKTDEEIGAVEEEINKLDTDKTELGGKKSKLEGEIEELEGELEELKSKTHAIPSINLFSYTFPSFPFINHHWLSEVIFYLSFALHPYSLIILKVLLS